jgi:HSP20 family protein
MAMAEKTSARMRYLRPRGSVTETRDGKLVATLEMPGVRKEDLEIRIENSELSIVGRRREPDAPKYLLRERPVGDFAQVYTLDETVDQSKVDAVLEKGILTLSLDLKEHVKPRTIAVRGE